MSCRSTTFGFCDRVDLFSKDPVHTDDLTITLFDLQILKIMLFQHIDDTLTCVQSFQTFNGIDLPVLDDHFDGQEPFAAYHLQYLDLGRGQS